MTDPARVDLAAWRRRLEHADPGLLTEVRALEEVLDAHVRVVEDALRKVGPLTSRFCKAFNRCHTEPWSLDADRDREELEDHLGISALWSAADRLLHAHPDA